MMLISVYYTSEELASILFLVPSCCGLLPMPQKMALTAHAPEDGNNGFSAKTKNHKGCVKFSTLQQ